MLTQLQEALPQTNSRSGTEKMEIDCLIKVTFLQVRAWMLDMNRF